MSEIRDYKNLIIWQRGMDIAQKCYYLTQKYPQEERYAMTAQIRKSASSIPAKIAEGYGRREYVDFLKIVQGSINELETYLILSTRVRLCPQSDIDEIISLLREESQMIVALIKKLDE